MLEFSNIKVYDLKESIISCRNAMRLEEPDYNSQEEFEKGLERAKKLVSASACDNNVKCHDNFMTGIRVSFDMKYTQYITKQFQRYHWFDYVSSSSLMHRITKMDFSKCCNKYVSQNSVDEVNKWIGVYNKILETHPDRYTFDTGKETFNASTYKDAIYYAFMMAISNCPMGTELFVRVSTNYKQLQTIYHQRKHHKLREDYQAFIDMVESLPYAKELILGETPEEKA